MNGNDDMSDQATGPGPVHVAGRDGMTACGEPLDHGLWNYRGGPMSCTACERVLAHEVEQALDAGRSAAYKATHQLIWFIQQDMRWAIKRVTLYGSRARGDNRPDSDVDLLVLMNGNDPRHRVGRLARRAKMIGETHNVQLDLKIVEEAHWAALEVAGARITLDVRRDGVVLL